MDSPLISGPGRSLDRELTAAFRSLLGDGSYAAQNGSAAEEEESSLLKHLRLLRRNAGILITAAFIAGIAGLVATMLLRPVYRSSVTLEIQGLNENFMNTRDVNPTANAAGSSPSYDIQTHVKVLQSRNLLDTVAKRVAAGVPETGTEEMQPAGRFDAFQLRQLGPVPRQEAISAAISSISVKTSGSDRIVEVMSDSPDPKVAAELLNALANEYIDQSLSARWQSSHRTAEFLTRQLEELKTKLERSQDELQAYAQSAGLLFTGDKQNVMQEKLEQMQQELSRAQADRIAKQALAELLSQQTALELPESMTDQYVREQQLELTKLRGELAELNTAFKDNFPKVAKLKARIAELDSALDKERANVLRRVQNDYETAKRREALLDTGYQAQSRAVVEQQERAIHYDILKREVDTNRQMYDSILQKVKEAGIAAAMKASNIRVVDPAIPADRPYKPSLWKNVVLGIFSGAFLGVLIVLARERADRSLREPGEVSLNLNVRELGAIPSAGWEGPRPPGKWRYSGDAQRHERAESSIEFPGELGRWLHRTSVVAEAFRGVLTSLMFVSRSGVTPKVVVLASANSGEGKSTVASNLGIAVAEINRRVLLIDADMREPRLHEIFGVPNGRGLSDILLESCSEAEADSLVLETEASNLFLLTSGSAKAITLSLLYSSTMPTLLAHFRERYDLVIIDTPPLLQIPDARVLGKMSEGVIMVCRSGATTKEALREAKQRLDDDGSTLLGVVLNDWKPDQGPQSYLYSHYYRRYRGETKGGGPRGDSNGSNGSIIASLKSTRNGDG